MDIDSLNSSNSGLEIDSLVEYAKSDPEGFVEYYSDDLQKLAQVIKKLVQENDSLNGVTRTSEGEEIIQDDEIVEDEEEYL